MEKTSLIEQGRDEGHSEELLQELIAYNDPIASCIYALRVIEGPHKAIYDQILKLKHAGAASLYFKQILKKYDKQLFEIILEDDYWIPELKSTYAEMLGLVK